MIYAAVAGEQLGVRRLAQGHLSRGIEGGESAIHSLPTPTIPTGPETRIHNLTIMSANSLTIRTRLSPTICDACENCHENYFTMHFSGPYASMYLCICLSKLQYWSATISILCEIEVYLIVFNVYLYFKP